MSSWQPSEQGLSDLLLLLHDARNPTGQVNVQEVGLPKKEQYVSHQAPSLTNSLTFLLDILVI